MDATPAVTSDKPQKQTPAGRLRTIEPIPPPLTWREEIDAIKDMADALAVSLWRALRNVRMWAETEPQRRRNLFHPPTRTTLEAMGLACAKDPELIEAFGTFSLLLRAPHQARKEQVADACRQVFEWAEERSLLMTAVHFAEAAATADPEHPARANDAGHICRRAALNERSAIWYQRGFGLAVRIGERRSIRSRVESIRALLGYGILMQFQGRYEEAKAYYERAVRRAVRTGRQRQAARAKHDLLTFAAEVGAYEEGERYATEALDLYPINDPQIPALAHDWAFLLIRFRHFTPVIPVLQLTAPHIQAPEIQTLVWGSLARAAAGARRRDLFAESERKVLLRVAQYEEYASAALIHLAEGARAFGQWDQAEQYAERAVEIARNRKQALQERDALELLRRIAGREAAPSEGDPPNPDRVRMLARRFTARLQTWKALGPRKPRADPDIFSDFPAEAKS